MVSTRTNLLVTVPRAPISIGIPFTFMFYSFFNFLAMSRYLSLFLLSFNFTLWSAGTAKFTIQQVLFFFLSITRSGCLAKIRWSVCISKSQRSLCISFFRTGSGLGIYHLFRFQFLAQFPVDHLLHPIVIIIIVINFHFMLDFHSCFNLWLSLKSETLVNLKIDVWMV